MNSGNNISPNTSFNSSRSFNQIPQFTRSTSPTLVGSPPTAYQDILTGPTPSTSPPTSTMYHSPVTYHQQPQMNQSSQLSLCAPTWKLSFEITNCCSCGVQASSLFKRKSICACCSLVFCNSCCNYKSSKLTGKICEECFRHGNENDLKCINRVYPCILDTRENIKRAAATELYEMICNNSQYCEILAKQNFFMFILREMIPNRDEFIRLMACKISVQIVEIQNILSRFLNDQELMGTLFHLVQVRDMELQPDVIQILSRLSINIENFNIDSESLKAISESILCLDINGIENISILLARCSENPKFISLFDQVPGCIVPILSLLSAESKNIIENGLIIIQKLSCTHHKTSLYEAGTLGLILTSLNKLIIDSSSIDDEKVNHSISLCLDCFIEFILRDDIPQDYCDVFVSSNGCNLLINILGSSDSLRSIKITSILYKLVSIPSLSENVIKELIGGLNLFFDLLTSDKSELIDFSLALILSMCSNENINLLVRETGGISRLVNILSSSDETHQQKSIIILGRMTKNDEENALAVLSSNGILPLVGLMTSQNLLIQQAAVNTFNELTNYPKLYSAIVAVGGIQSLLSLLNSPRGPIQEISLSSLLNLSSNQMCLESIYSFGNITFLKPLLTSIYQGVKENSLKLLYLFTKEKKFYSSMNFNPCIQPLTILLGDEQIEIQNLG